MKPIVNEPAGTRYGAAFPRRLAMPSVSLRIIVILTIGAGLVVILNRIQHDTVLTLVDTRPIVQLAALIMGGAALWGIGVASVATAQHHQQIAWRTSLRMVGWIGFLCGAVGLAVFMFQSDDVQGLPIGGAVRAVESLIPLAIGIQAAFLFSPDDEPGIEVLLACSRRISWVLMERLGVMLLSQAGLALVGMAVSMAITGERDIFVVAARWISPALLFSGVGTYVTLASRQPALSVAIVGIAWFLFSFMGGALLPGQPTMWPLNLIQPFVWAIHPYLQLGDLSREDWWLNRAFVASIGVALVMLSVRQLRDEERVLLGGPKAKKQARGE